MLRFIQDGERMRLFSNSVFFRLRGISFCLCFCSLACLYRDDAQIQKKDLAYFVRRLSSNSFGGRLAGSRFALKTVSFLSAYYKRHSFVPAFDNSYVHTFIFPAGYTASPKKNHLLFSSKSSRNTIDLSSSSLPLPLSRSSKKGYAKAELEFAGYCLQVGKKWNDLKYLRLKNKISLCLRYGPGGAALREHPQLAYHISFSAKYRNLKRKGVRGVIFLDEPGKRGGKNKKYPPPSLEAFPKASGKGPPAVFIKSEELLKYDKKGILICPKGSQKKSLAIIEAETAWEASLNSLQKKICKYIEALPTLPTLPKKPSFSKLLTSPLKTHSKSQVSPPIRVEMRTDLETQKKKGYNVGAYLYPPEAGQKLVILGAHHDHLGLGYFASMGKSREIHRGADDNASGTALVLELARALQAESKEETIRKKARLNVLFIHFDAEEYGLLGSQAFVRSEYFQKLRKKLRVIAMLNADMVGRLNPKRGLQVRGAQSAREPWPALLKDSFRRAAFPKKYTLHLRKEGRGPSDHSTFYERKIPVAFFFTGLHKQYHRPNDDFSRINLEGLYSITQMNYILIRSLEALEKPLRFRGEGS